MFSIEIAILSVSHLTPHALAALHFQTQKPHCCTSEKVSSKGTPKSKGTDFRVAKPNAINLPFGEDLYHPFMIITSGGLLLGLPLYILLLITYIINDHLFQTNHCIPLCFSLYLGISHYYRKWPLLVILVPLLTPIHYRFFIYPVCTPNVSGVWSNLVFRGNSLFHLAD